MATMVIFHGYGNAIVDYGEKLLCPGAAVAAAHNENVFRQ